MTNLDAIAYAVNVENQGSSLDGDHATGAGELVLVSVYNFPATGSVEINGDVYDYTAVDELTNTVTLSGVTTADYLDGDRVELSPAAPIWYATVVVGSDQPGFNAMIPIHLVPFLADDIGGSVFPEGVPVIVESIAAGEYQWQVVAAPGRQPKYNAAVSEVYIATPDGEAFRANGDGTTWYTNDFPQLAATIAGTFNAIATDGTFVYAVDSASDIRKFDVLTGAENLSGFPIVGTFDTDVLAVDGGFIYTVDSSADIRKYDSTTGVQNTSGFPIAGTFGSLTNPGLAAADGFVYAVDGATFDIRKFDATTGVENVSGFPIAGSFGTIDVDNGFIYAIDTGTAEVRKYDATTGVLDAVSGFPVSTYGRVAAADGFVYGRSGVSFDILKFDADTAAENTSGFPLVGNWFELAAASGVVAVTSGDTADITTYIYPEGFESVRIESGTGVLLAKGQASLAHLGHNNQKTLSTTATPTSTANVNMPSLSMKFSVNGPDDVVWVDIDAYVSIGAANTDNTIELLIDGVADPKQLHTRGTTASLLRACGYKKWRLTGLAPGIHTIAFRTRNNAAATDASVLATHTGASYWTST